MNTSLGPLEIELWCRETPQTSRNFIQLCLEGFYDECPFHRILPGFILQGGDPVGDGGASVTGEPIKLEWSHRLKFNRRGLLGMVSMPATGNLGPGSASQFFFTLAESPSLDRECTLFGQLAGNSIYTLLKVNDLEVDKRREMFIGAPPKIISIQVVENPFDDIVPRQLVRLHKDQTQGNIRGEARSKPAIPAVGVASKKSLSFGDYEEDGADDIVKPVKKFLSSHEALNDPSLSRQRVSLAPEASGPKQGNNGELTREKMIPATPMSFLDPKANQVRNQIAQVEAQLRGLDHSSGNLKDLGGEHASPPPASLRTDSLSRLLGVKPGGSAEKSSASPAPMTAVAAAFKERKRTMVGKRNHSALEEMDTLLALNNFREKLKATGSEELLKSVAKRRHTDLQKGQGESLVDEKDILLPERMDICKLHGLVGCESCRDTFGTSIMVATDGAEGGEANGVQEEEGWLMHRLVFDKDAGYRRVRADLDQLQVIDPRTRSLPTQQPFRNK